MIPRFFEDERPIPDLPAEFDVVIDGIEDLQAGPYIFNLVSEVRLHCRFGRARIHIEEVAVRDYARRTRYWTASIQLPEPASQPEWRAANEHDHLVWLITDLIRARYDTPEGQAFLRAAADREEVEEA